MGALLTGYVNVLYSNQFKIRTRMHAPGFFIGALHLKGSADVASDSHVAVKSKGCFKFEGL